MSVARIAAKAKAAKERKNGGILHRRLPVGESRRVGLDGSRRDRFADPRALAVDRSNARGRDKAAWEDGFHSILIVLDLAPLCLLSINASSAPHSIAHPNNGSTHAYTERRDAAGRLLTMAAALPPSSAAVAAAAIVASKTCRRLRCVCRRCRLWGGKRWIGNRARRRRRGALQHPPPPPQHAAGCATPGAEAVDAGDSRRRSSSRRSRSRSRRGPTGGVRAAGGDQEDRAVRTPHPTPNRGIYIHA